MQEHSSHTRCPHCDQRAASAPNYAVLLNPWVWLFDSPLYAPRYCLDCRGALALGGIVFAAIVIAAAVFVAILLW